METEHIICVTKNSVDSMIEVFDEALRLLEINNELLTKKEDLDKNYDIERKVKSEREIYKKVKAIMENKGHKTLCLSSKDI